MAAGAVRDHNGVAGRIEGRCQFVVREVDGIKHILQGPHRAEINVGRGRIRKSDDEVCVILERCHPRAPIDEREFGEVADPIEGGGV